MPPRLFHFISTVSALIIHTSEILGYRTYVISTYYPYFIYIISSLATSIIHIRTLQPIQAVSVHLCESKLWPIP